MVEKFTSVLKVHSDCNNTICHRGAEKGLREIKQWIEKGDEATTPDFPVVALFPRLRLSPRRKIYPVSVPDETRRAGTVGRAGRTCGRKKSVAIWVLSRARISLSPSFSERGGGQR